MGGRDVLIKKVREWIQQLFEKNNIGSKYRVIIAIALIGILLIVVSNLFNPSISNERLMQENLDATADETDIEEVSLITNVSEIEASYEKDLQAMLSQIQGVSEVEVMVNVDSTNVNIYEKDLIVGKQSSEEADRNGGSRTVEDETQETKLVFIRQGDQEVPVLVQTRKPEVRGVFIIAKGADNATVKQWIVESVSKVLDVPSYKISVMPK